MEHFKDIFDLCNATLLKWDEWDIRNYRPVIKTATIVRRTHHAVYTPRLIKVKNG